MDRKAHNNITTSTPNSKYKHRRPYHSMEFLENIKESNLKRHNADSSSNLNANPSNKRSTDRIHRNVLRERNGRSSSETRHLPPVAPTKPAREFDRRRALSR